MIFLSVQQYIHFSIEIWGALFSLVALITVFATRYFDKPGSRRLLFVLFCSFALMICDSLTWIYLGNTSQLAYYIVRSANFGAYFLGMLNMAVSAEYISHLVYKRTDGIDLNWKQIEWVLFFIGTILLIINLYSPYIYTFDENNTYIRLRDYFWLPDLVIFMEAAVSLSVAIVYIKYLLPMERVAMVSYLVLPMIAIIISEFLYSFPCTNIAVVISTIILFVSYEAYYAQYLVEQQKRISEERLRLVNHQMQPHFIFNTVSLIRYQCLNAPEKAAETINDFSDYLRSTTDLMLETECISFERELDIVKNYIRIQKKRFEDELSAEYHISDTDFDVPPYAVQTMVENAVQHGIRDGNSGKGTVIITTKKIKKLHIITIEDNGCGFDTSILEKKGKKNIGIKNTAQRIEAMCKGTLTVESTPGTGRKVTITIPSDY